MREIESNFAGMVLLLEAYPVTDLESGEKDGGIESHSTVTSTDTGLKSYLLTAPLPTEAHILSALSGLASFHAAAWENNRNCGNSKPILNLATHRLQRYGGSFHLSIRDPKEIGRLVGNWERFCGEFKEELCGSYTDSDSKDVNSEYKDLLSVGHRLFLLHQKISSELSVPNDDSKYATLLHGDFKAMNCLVPVDPSAENSAPVLIDFAQSGLGYGMSDVGFLVAHSVEIENDVTKSSDSDAAEKDIDTHVDTPLERRLVSGYLKSLREKIKVQKEIESRASNGDAIESKSGESLTLTDSNFYPDSIAYPHYRLAYLDYARFLIARFWTHAGFRTAFESKSKNPNVTLPNRSVEAAVAFARNVQRKIGWAEEFFGRSRGLGG